MGDRVGSGAHEAACMASRAGSAVSLRIASLAAFRRPISRLCTIHVPQALSSQLGSRANSTSSSGSSGVPTPGTTMLVGGQEVPFERKRQHMGEPERLTCTSCGFVYYENPKLVTGSVATYTDPDTNEELILLCRRAIPPRIGRWNLCAGYMEKGETLKESAVREAWEEAYARLDSLRLLSMYEITHIGQVHVYFHAKLLGTDVAAGDESLEVKMFRWQDLPWHDLAFPTVSWALMHYHMHRGGEGEGEPFGNPVLKGFEGSTNVWYRPEKGLYFNDTWLQGERKGT